MDEIKLPLEGESIQDYIFRVYFAPVPAMPEYVICMRCGSMVYKPYRIVHYNAIHRFQGL
jgi:hypothetical protein